MEEPAFQITQFVKRPIAGNVGRKIRVRANFFEITKMQDANILHYDVNITPEVPPRLNMKVFDRFVEQNQRALGNAKPVFDGMYSTIKRLFFRY